jgi:hypothetical protein
MPSLRAALLPGPAPAANTTASAPLHHRGDLGDRDLFQVWEHGLGARGTQVVEELGVAHQPGGRVPALREQALQPHRDLPVPTGDHHAHSPTIDPVLPRAVLP